MDALFQAATEARSQAYAPYSGYTVGAAVQADDGSIFRGCNVENVAYGSTICAERFAIGAMIAAGRRRISRLAVVTRDGGTPCGACLQVILEFGESPDDVQIVTASEGGTLRVYTLRELLPHGFCSPNVDRTNSQDG